MNLKAKKLTLGFVPWWPQNPYQVLLRGKLREHDFRVIGNPPFNLFKILLKRDGLDIVHLHWPHDLYFHNYLRYPIALLTLLLFKIRKDNLVWTVHELEFYETKYPKLDAFFIKFLMRNCRALLVHSQYSEKEILNKFDYKGHIFQLKHPSYIGAYDNTITKEKARQLLGINLKSKVFLFLGYIKPYKGVEDLIDSFSQIKNKDARLIIAGTPLNNTIKNRLIELSEGDSRIILKLKYIPDEDIQLYLNASDLVAFPFRQTHTSGSVLLAASFKKPVLVPNCASIPEYIDNSMGFFFDPDIKGSLTKALMKAATTDLANMGDNAFNNVSAYTWDEMAAVHKKVYQLIASGKAIDND